MDKASFDRIIRRLPGIGQSLGPLFWLISKVELTDPHVILEIGTGMGGSLKFWEQLVKPGDLVVSVDVEPDLKRIVWDYKGSDRKILLIVGDSMDEKTVTAVKETLSGRSVDFLFIDGGHLYENVSTDFRNYMPFVKVGGLVGFHDLSDPDVRKLFDELEGEKETSKSWMRPQRPLTTLPEKVGDDKFTADLKGILDERWWLTGNNGLVCTGVWWKRHG